MIYLRKGDVDSQQTIKIIDEDRLCFLVLSQNRGAQGLRTISKSLLEEFIAYEKQNPEATAQMAREALSGNSDIDKFEYGYNSTLLTLAKLNKTLSRERKGNAIIENVHSIITYPLQQIFYGAPGTGKSHEIKKTTDLQPKENVFRTTFHPDSDYSTFVGCYKPTKEKRPVRNVAGDIVKHNGEDVYEDAITYKFVPQAFLKAYIRAYQTTDPVYLVIEEINRGNCAQIFGDLFQLLDREDGVSEYPIKADDDLAKYLRDTYGEDFAGIANGELCLPSNLYIWATMNTSDQSLFPIDSAFKRRWEWQYMPIEDAGKNWKIRVNNNEYDWYAFLTAINHEILALTHSEDKQLGYFFAKADAQGVIDAAKLVNKVYFYLWTDVFKDYETENNSVFKKADSNDTIAYKDFFVSGQKINEEVAEQLLKNLKLNTPETE